MNEKVFRDPVHNYIHIDNPLIYDLINTKEFNAYDASNKSLQQLSPSTAQNIAVFLTA